MLYATFGSDVNARLETVWNLLLDKAENPQRYIPQQIEEVKILERYKDGFLRLMGTSEVHIKERITVDEQTKEVTFTLLDHPVYTGKLINKVISVLDGNSEAPLLLTYIVALHPLSEEAQKNNPAEAQWFKQIAAPETIQQAVLHMKNIAEQQDYQNGITTKETGAMSEKLLEEKTDIVKRMFKAGESMNVESFIKFYTDDALFQFSNFPVVYGSQGIRDASFDFLKKVEQVYHHIKNIWEVRDAVICEMEVTYIRYDSKVFTLPCCDTIRFKGDKVQELRIYMDISAVFA